MNNGIELTFNPELLDAVFAPLRLIQPQLEHTVSCDYQPQPIHTVYGGAQLYKVGSLRKLGEMARLHFLKYAPDAESLSRLLNDPALDSVPWTILHQKVCERLQTSPIDDYRIDFEDGYGYRPSVEEDAAALLAAEAMSEELSLGGLPRFSGIRIRSFTPGAWLRAARTLDLFISKLLTCSGGKLPPGFVVTLPKVSQAEQVDALVLLLSQLEHRFDLADGVIKIELMIESPAALMSADGTSPLRRLLAAAKGRCRGVHFGTYDYSAACDITADHQSMSHPACVWALNTIKVALGATGVWLADGATNILPLPVHRAVSEKALSPKEEAANARAVIRAWRLSYANISNSLKLGFYQGWDLHPNQIGIRLAAHYAFFLKDLADASIRLRNFIEKAAQATAIGGVFDDAASGQGLLNFFIRAVDAGAIGEAEIGASGLTMSDLRSRSFLTIVESQRRSDAVHS